MLTGLELINALNTILLFFAFFRLMQLFFDVRKSSAGFFVISHFLFATYLLWRAGIFFPQWQCVLQTWFSTLEHPFLQPFIHPFSVNFAMTGLAIFLITLNYESKIIKRITFPIFSFIFWDSLIAIGRNFFNFLPPVSLLFRTVVGNLIAVLLFHLIITIFKRPKKDRTPEVVPSYFWSLVWFFSTGLFFIYLFRFLDSIHLIPTIGIVAFIGNIAIFFLYTEINKSHKNAIKAATYEMEREHYSEQLQLMQQSAEQIKAIRHDMKLHLSTIASYNANNNAQAATDYINKLLGEISKSEVYSETGNITFDSIINFKLNNAKIDNLKPQIHSIIPDAINIEVADIVTILGNLLDNALEAVANEKDKMLKLDVELSKETLFIKVENTFGGELKYAVGKDGDTNHIATQKSGSEHGYGLKNVRRTVEKYNGCMDITHENGVFSVTVMLYV